MKLATFIAPGDSEPQAGEVRDGEVVAFASGTVLDRIASGDRTPADGNAYPADQVTLLAPIPRPPAIFCVGRNSAGHIAEMGSDKPEKPLVFLKLPLSSVPPPPTVAARLTSGICAPLTATVDGATKLHCTLACAVPSAAVAANSWTPNWTSPLASSSVPNNGRGTPLPAPPCRRRRSSNTPS